MRTAGWTGCSLVLIGLGAATAAEPAKDKAADAIKEKAAKPWALTAEQAAEGWTMLFDGQTPFGWVESPAISVADGCLVIGPKAAEGQKAAVGQTTSEFGSFELHLSYKVDGPGPAQVTFNESGYDLKAAADGQWVDSMWKVEGSKGHHRVTFSDGRRQTQVDRDTPSRTTIQLSVPADSRLIVRRAVLKPLGLKPIFNGKDLAGWKEIPDKASKFTVTPKGELNVTNGNGDLQSEGQWADFVLQLDVISNGKQLNSGVFFRAIPGQFWSGYESQIRNQWEGDDRTKPVDYGTGGVYNQQKTRKVVSSDGEWFTKTIVAHGKHISVWVNGYQTADWTDPRPMADSGRKGCKTAKGCISLQGHDPTTNLSFRKIKVADLGEGKKGSQETGDRSQEKKQ